MLKHFRILWKNLGRPNREHENRKKNQYTFHAKHYKHKVGR